MEHGLFVSSKTHYHTEFLLNASSLEELSEIRLLMDAGICFMMLGGWLDFVLMYCGWSFGFL